MILKNVKLTISNERGAILGYIDISEKRFASSNYNFSSEIKENLDMVDELYLYSELLKPIEACINKFNNKHSMLGKS